MTVLVYKYGSREPIEGLETVVEQFRLAHRYRNKLVELELERRAQVDAALRAACPELVLLEEEIGTKARDAEPEDPVRGIPAQPPQPATGLHRLIEDAAAAVKQRRMRERGRRRDPTERAALRALRARLAAARERRRELRTELFGSDSWQASQRAIEAAHHARLLAERKASGLYWGTYEVVEAAADQFRKGAPPRFRPWRLRKDRLCVRLNQGNLSVEELLGGEDNRVGMSVIDRPQARPDSNRAAKRKFALVRYRVGGKDTKTHAVLPIVYHRPLPADAVIKLVYLIRRDVGARSRWSVQFVIETQETKPKADQGVVGVDVGWRKMPDGRLRVAVTSGSDGHEQEWALPPWWLSERDRVRRIKSERDRLFDLVKPVASGLIRGADNSTERARQSVSHLHQWRSQARLAGLILDWKDNDPGPHWDVPAEIAELPGEHSIDPERLEAALREPNPPHWVLEAWRLRDLHLHEYEANLRDQLQASRLDLYRNLAATLAQRYRTAAVEQLDLRNFHVLPPVEDGATVQDDVMKEYVRDACLSKIFDSLKHRMAQVVEIDPANTTKICHACRHLDEDWTEHQALFHICPNCGAEWDQDVNAARNLLRAGGSTTEWDSMGPAPDGSGALSVRTIPSRGGPNKAQRRARARRARLEQLQGQAV